MRVAYGVLKDRLKAASVHFTNKGSSRFSDSDVLTYVEGCSIEPHCGFLGGNNLFEMGSFSYSWSKLHGNARVGRYCSIAAGLKLLGGRHPMEWVSTSSFTYDGKFPLFKELNDAEGGLFKPAKRPVFESRIVIGHDVWIGGNVTLKPGITIGTGSVIAASSLVVKDVPPYSVVGGNPAKIIKRRFDDKTVNRLLSSEWWNYKFTDFSGIDVQSPLGFCDELEKRIGSGEVVRYAPEKLVLSSVAGSTR
ncbi:CatB-related O-acetyltransferase [Pseudomonas fluorescens]|uniref:2,3,4,5-tetrahydropyridine-2,6-dicarboxylate N-acetyltransferase n=1 Tax=Pseudomonas fluorescens TaxID=294 RepID=A0A5E7D4G4_PSEFL|nr:CatB-related O-acetyltransferase [Pseudomonas fluorescens]VVO11906.1 2,3,4,5-tetrahydropyridine-2,6-dicarboxylate N-acetyltransferase [Pseudomonas fluorescens]